MIWLHCMRFGFLCIGLLLVYSSGCLDAMHFNSILTCCREQKEKHINNNIKARPKRYLTLKREIRVVSVVVGFFVIHRVFRVSCLFTPIPWIGLIVLFLLLVLFLSSRNKVVSFFFQKIVSLNIFFSCFSSRLPGNAEFFVYRHLCSAHTIHTSRMYFCNVAVCYVFISFWNCSVDNRFISYTK